MRENYSWFTPTELHNKTYDISSHWGYAGATLSDYLGPCSPIEPDSKHANATPTRWMVFAFYNENTGAQTVDAVMKPDDCHDRRRNRRVRLGTVENNGLLQLTPELARDLGYQRVWVGCNLQRKPHRWPDYLPAWNPRPSVIAHTTPA